MNPNSKSRSKPKVSSMFSSISGLKPEHKGKTLEEISMPSSSTSCPKPEYKDDSLKEISMSSNSTSNPKLEHIKDDPLMTCPYDPVHQILKSRFETHLIKCRKNHPDTKKINCPLNATHLVDRREMDWHLEICESRKSYDMYKYILDSKLKKKKNCNLDIVPASEPEPIKEPESELESKPEPESEPEPRPINLIENWNNDPPIPSYNPEGYITSAPIIRRLIGATRSQKKAFREAEHRRLKNL